jgi:hypothetical protein
MKSLEEIREAHEAIRSVLNIDLTASDIIEDTVSKGHKLSALLGLSAETVASSKRLLSEKELDVFDNDRDEIKKLTPNLGLRFLKAKCFEEQELVDLSDRYNAAITHTLELIRTNISLYKAEIGSQTK